jgi:hypothetical protein
MLDPQAVALTAIYLHGGFFLSPQVEEARKAYEPNGGHIELMVELCQVANEITAMLETETREYPGVYHYEVTELVGSWLADQLAANGRFLMMEKPAIQEFISAETEKFFNQ